MNLGGAGGAVGGHKHSAHRTYLPSLSLVLSLERMPCREQPYAEARVAKHWCLRPIAGENLGLPTATKEA